MNTHQHSVRIGIDLGGTKIAAIALGRGDHVLEYIRTPTPQGDYAATCAAIAGVVADLETRADCAGAPVGLGIPGSLSPKSNLVRNANSTCLNGHNLKGDLEEALARPVRIANDADCFAISEATDGAGQHHRTVWGVILGTGVGGGIVVDRALHYGPLAVAGEWGHNPLPWMSKAEFDTADTCWCGRRGCMETWVSGPALSADHKRATGNTMDATEICAAAEAGDPGARASLSRHLSRLARGMAQVINILDPDVIVMGGGLSQMPHLIAALPDAIAPHVFSDHVDVEISAPHWGDDSGVRGAARLWPDSGRPQTLHLKT